MQKVTLLSGVYLDDRLKNFVENVNKDIVGLNALIDDYNKINITDHDLAVNKLKEIVRYKQWMESKYSNKCVNDCEEYSKIIHIDLFLSIQSEFARRGITNLYRIVDPIAPENTLSDILTNMKPEKINRLIAILSKGSKFNRSHLAELYEGVDTGTDAVQFREFLTNNSIESLPGTNSKNFKIIPRNGSPPYVLKIENRMGMPKEPVVHLQERPVKDRFVPVMAERQGSVGVPPKRITRTILTTEFCSGGTLMAHSYKHYNDYPNRIKAALNIYDQMLSVLIDIGKAHCAFPDMKNTNWLLDKDNRLLITDTKSFIFCEDDGNIGSTKTGVIFSALWSPPEFFTNFEKGAPISADKMHAYIFGKNLYQYLTQCQEVEVSPQNSQLNFDYPIFRTKEGKELKQLIQNLVKENPEERISLREAREELMNIKLNIIRKESFDILRQIEARGFGVNDLQMKEFIEQQRAIIQGTLDPHQLEAKNTELQIILRQQQDVDDVKTVVEKCRAQTNIFNIEELEQAVCVIPIEDRGKITDQSHETEAAVRLQTSASMKLTGLDILLKIEARGFGKKDLQMKVFIEQQRDFIQATLDPYQLETKNTELNTILCQQQAAEAVKEYIEEFRGRRAIFTKSLKDKAGRIEQAICQIPITDRGRITDENFKGGHQLHLAAAEHRHFKGMRTPKTDQQGKIDVKKASKGYSAFKNKLTEIKSTEAPNITEPSERSIQRLD